MDETTLRSELKSLIVATLNLEGLEPTSISDDGPLFGAGLGLDSVDALELMVAIEKKYGLKLEAHESDRSAFASVSALASLVQGELVRAGSSSLESSARGREPAWQKPGRDRRRCDCCLSGVDSRQWVVRSAVARALEARDGEASPDPDRRRRAGRGRADPA